MWKPAYKRKRYRNLTKRGISLFWIVWTGSMVFSFGVWLPRIDVAFWQSLAGLVVTAWAIQFAGFELLHLFAGSHDTRTDT